MPCGSPSASGVSKPTILEAVVIVERASAVLRSNVAHLRLLAFLISVICFPGGNVKDMSSFPFGAGWKTIDRRDGDPEYRIAHHPLCQGTSSWHGRRKTDEEDIP